MLSWPVECPNITMHIPKWNSFTETLQKVKTLLFSFTTIKKKLFLSLTTQAHASLSYKFHDLWSVSKLHVRFFRVRTKDGPSNNTRMSNNMRHGVARIIRWAIRATRMACTCNFCSFSWGISWFCNWSATKRVFYHLRYFSQAGRLMYIFFIFVAFYRVLPTPTHFFSFFVWFSRIFKGN